MLQPRSSWIFAVILVANIASGKSDNLLKENERWKRQIGGDVTVLSLEENGRFRESPLGVLSSTARTFVNGGATTEFATQILGTTLGRTYARLLSTGSRVFYDSPKPSKDPYLVFPTLVTGIISPTVSEVQYQTAEPITVKRPVTVIAEEPQFAQTQPLSFNEIHENLVPNTSPRAFVSVRKEYSVKRNSEVKPAKVKPNANLPTVTIKNEFSPSGYSDAMDNLKRDDAKKPRGGKGLFRGGVQIKNEFQKFDTVTYVGFADFTTTVGNTIIIFMPKTAAANAGPVTSISGAATLRPEDVSVPVVTNVKTFMSHSPGMATKTVTGHNINTQTSLPTIQAETRFSKAYNPVYITTEQYTTESLTSTETIPEEITEESTTEQRTTESAEEQQTTASPTTEEIIVEFQENPLFESSEVVLPEVEEITPTEALLLKPTPTYATTQTQIFIPGDEPLGLAKSISVIEAYDGTTTHFTSFLFGTIVNDQYTQLTQVVSSVAQPTTIEPTAVLTDINPTTTAETITESNPGDFDQPTTTEEEFDAEEKINGDKPVETSTLNYLTKLVPTTIRQTYTYFTTFFIPTGKSIKSREVETDETRYVTTVVLESTESTANKQTIFPSAVTETARTESLQDSIQTTERDGTTEMSSQTLETTPSLQTLPEVTTEDVITTTEATTQSNEETSEENDELVAEKGKEDEEEVEIVIKTLYTTYTYLTTFFQETATSVQSREVVETNVVTSTLDTAYLPEATDPAVADLFNSESTDSDIMPTNVVERPQTQETEPLSSNIVSSDINTSPYKTYTYYTTVFVDGETIIESRTEVVSETADPTSASQVQFSSTASVEDNNIVPAEYNDGQDLSKKKPTYGTITRQKFSDSPSSEALVMPTYNAIQSSIDDAYSYDTTMSRIDRIVSTVPVLESTVPEEELSQAREDELKKEAMIAIGLTPTDDSEFVETMVTDITSSSSGGSRKVYDEYESDPNDQISSESNTEEIEPSFTPTILLQTSYTTFTYFTTVYKGTSSDIISRLETVTNIVTETVRPTELEAKLSPEEATLPITYFTTFTYWTTLYRGKSTMITSREETVSNIVTPTLNLETETIEITDSPIAPSTSIFNGNIDSLKTTSVPLEVKPTEASDYVTPLETATITTDSDTSSSESPTEVAIEPTTYFITYTYFTTSYIGNDTIINSHLETETNVVTPTATQDESSSSTDTLGIETLSSDLSMTEEVSPLQPTGLISTIRSSEVNDGITTLLNTDVYGTYIDGLYAQVLESSSEILAPTLASSSVVEAQPTGVVSINEGKIIDAEGISTTLYTTKAVGTYIDSLYAQIIESTSSVLVDEAKRTALPTEQSTTVIGSKVFTTGLVRLIEGSIIKDKTTTYYESRVIGTLIDGRYAQIIESTSSFRVEMASTKSPAISATPTVATEATISPTLPSSTVSPAAIESSLNEQNEDGDKSEEEDETGKSKSRLSFTTKKNTFTPVIRPFSSKRQRPTFLPKKKTGDPATTITRASFTPTVTATPASKTGGFGSSRNRFAANRKSSSSHSLHEIKPTSSSSRKFSRSRSTSSAGSGGGGSFGSGSRSFGRSSSKIHPTSSSFSRRGGFNYRSTANQRPNAASSSSRFRVRPTQSSSYGRFAPSVNPVDDINNNDIGGPSSGTDEPESYTPGEDEQTTTPTTTTESVRRANNPLLRFRRPPILQRASTTTTTTSKPSTTPKRNSLLRRPDARGSGPTTPRARPTPNFNRVKPRPASSLFPPRGLIRKPSPAEEAEEKEEEENENNEENEHDDIQDNEYEGSETSELQSSTTAETPKNERRGKGLNVVQIRPFVRRPRTKRQIEYGNRGYTSKYRRPSTRTTVADYIDYYDVTPEAPPKPTPTGRFSSRTRGQNSHKQQQQQVQQQRVRPSPTSSTQRHQFTLRESKQKQTTTNPGRTTYSRRTTTSPRRRTNSELTTIAQRPKPPKLRTPTTEQPTTLSRGTSRRYSNSRRPTSRMRHREKDDYDMYNYMQPVFDGTITVTHRIPTEVTIPVFNGKSTEYKNVITAKPSLEVLGPFQYTTTTGKDGKQIILLTSDITSTLPNGLMEVTKFFVHETPTTSVTFTPTVLRGRKTSFSHIVPSTVYDVQPEVSTVQPNLGNNPLANLLLSQLLLGNLGIPNTAGPQTPASPTTEFKTKTTTYVTTITSHTSTVLPLTFRGKEITTTIVDSSTQVITATEYITETIVITPSAVPQINNQLNTLLIPALLQAQLLGQQQTVNPLLGLQPKPQNDVFNINERAVDDDLERFNSRLKASDEEHDDNDDEYDERKVRESYDEFRPENEQKPVRKKTKVRIKERNHNKPKATSVITLYVSGKHPGEFTTLLSTVNADEGSNLRKREINAAAYVAKGHRIEASKLPELGGSFSDLDTYTAPSLNDVLIESSEIETQSLESAVGDISHYLSLSKSADPQILSSKKSALTQNSVTGHFLLKGLADSAPDQRKEATRGSVNRNKRDTEDVQPRRRRIRVKVPINKAEEDVQTTTQQSDFEEETAYNVNRFGQNTSQRVRIIKKKLITNETLQDQPRRRLLVTRRRPVEVTETITKDSERNIDEEEPTEAPNSSLTKRRIILKTRKRIINHESKTELPSRKLVTITRKRLIQTDLFNPENVPNLPTMSTLYNYKYSIPSDESSAKGNVLVSEIFMSGGNDEAIEDSYRSYVQQERGNSADVIESTTVHPSTSELHNNFQEQVETPSLDGNKLNTALYNTRNRNQLTKVGEELNKATASTQDLHSTNVNDYSDFSETVYDDLQTSQEPEYDSEYDDLINITTEKEETKAQSKEEPKEVGVKIEEDLNDMFTENYSETTTHTVDDIEVDSRKVMDAVGSSTVISSPLFTTKTLTTTRLRTYTYVITRVSGNEQVITSSLSVKPDVKTITVTESLPVSITSPAADEGRGFYLTDKPRYHLATKIMSNGVEVIVAGDKSTLPGMPSVRIKPTALNKPITLAPSTVTDHMMMLLPQETQKPHNDFVTKTYMTTYTYLTTFAQDGSTVVSSREKVISNVVTEEVKPSKTKAHDHFTLASSPDLTTGVYHTTYTYLNTLVEGELPLVVTSKKTVANTVTEQPTLVQPSELPIQDTNTYLSTVAYTKTFSNGDDMKIVSTQDVLTQVVITESDYLPSSVDIKPTAITTDITKTYFVTYTYYNTAVEDDQTVVKTEVATSSDVVTETYTIQPKRPTNRPVEATQAAEINEDDSSQSLDLYATKTYLTTFTYFTTLLQDNKSPSIIVKSRTKVQQNVVTESIDSSLLDSDYLSILKSSVHDQQNSMVTTATLLNGNQMEITAVLPNSVRATDKVDINTSFEETSPSNVITGSTIIFFDDAEESTANIEPSFTDSYSINQQTSTEKLSTPSLLLSTRKPSLNAGTSNENSKVSDKDTQELSTTTASTPIKNILQIGSLGINSFQALGPVINAMADLFQGSFNKDKKRNDTLGIPLMLPKPNEPTSTQRSPVYIPVAPLDSEPSESQHLTGMNVFPDSLQRTKPMSDGPSIETALLSGGIPISPGQVITTNSDVIIGKHSVHGPRPPLKPFGKDTTVEGMKPPPPPKGNWPPIRDQERYPSLLVPHRVPPSMDPLPFLPKRDHPPVNSLKEHYTPHNDMHHKPPQLHGNYPEVNLDQAESGNKFTVPNVDVAGHDDLRKEQLHQHFDKLHKTSNKHPFESHRNTLKPQVGVPHRINERPRPPVGHNKLRDTTLDLRPPPPVDLYRPDKNKPIYRPHVPFDQKEEPSNVHLEVTTAKYRPITVPSAEPKPTTEPNLSHQLLVNIQPSQVANVIIPHGISTALIYNSNPDKPSQKGEIFNEPSPYPDAEVGMVGVAGLSSSGENSPQAAHIPPNAVRMDVPVSPQGINLDSLKNPSGSSNTFHKNKIKQENIQSHSVPSNSNKMAPLNFMLGHQSGLQYMTPPPPLPTYVNYHLGLEDIEDQEGEYSFNNEYHTKDHDAYFNQNKPSEFVKKPNKNIISHQGKPFSNSTFKNEDSKYTVLNTNPVILDSHEKQPAIIKGKPGITSFENNSEATVSVGQTTHLKPNDAVSAGSSIAFDVNSHIRKPSQLENKNERLPEKSRPSKPFDTTVYTMNMDERPPPPTFETPPHITTFDIPNVESVSSTQLPKKEFDKNPVKTDSVLGLTPPAPVTRYSTHEKTTHRPLLSSRRPFPLRKKPPVLSSSPPSPPYKFEIPRPTYDSKPKKPTYLETEHPPPMPAPTEILSPPKSDNQYLHVNNLDKTERVDVNKFVTTRQPESINPILGGTLKVEEIPQKPEVITANSKVVLNNNLRPGHQINPSHDHSHPKITSEFSPTRTNQVILQTTKSDQILTGSETVFPEDTSTTSTQSINKPELIFSSTKGNVVSNIITKSGVANFIKPTGTIKHFQTVFSIVVGNSNSPWKSESGQHTPNNSNRNISNVIFEKFNIPNIVVSSAPSKHIITHTHTLTVTTTESRIIQSKGQKPSTHTLIVTKTQTSTILDTVTEIHTLVKPTSILSTVTTTVSHTPSTIIAPSNTLSHPEPSVNHKEMSSNKNELGDNDSILVVMTDNNTKKKLPNFSIDTGDMPEIVTNDLEPNILLGGFLTNAISENECKPECKATRNERCQKINNIMRCVCRPGFARMFPDHPCKPTYTYSMHVPLERLGKEKINYSQYVMDVNSQTYQTLIDATKEGLHRMVMQSDLRDIYHGIEVTGFNHKERDDIVADFYIQLSENTEEPRLVEVFKKHLTNNNFSMGGTELHARKEKLQYLKAEDFDECSDTKFHDCSENAQCFNLRGTYTCSCKEGFTDLSHNNLYPGRVCSAEMIGCQRCSYHGNCYSRNGEEDLCECFQWYAGQYCQINLKVMLLILSLVGISLIVLLIVCLVLSCMRGKPRHARKVPLRPSGFRLPRGPPQQDKRAMISMDTSSEASMDHTPPPYIKQAVSNVQRPKPCRKQSKAPSPPLSYHGTMEQRDRSLTVMIPRAKYRPVPPQANSSLMTMSTFGPEQKLLKYLTTEKPSSRGNSRKPSNSTNHSHESTIMPKKTQSTPPLRKPSTGALVSAGFEVSATVGRSKEIHECFITEPHTDLGQPGFSTIRTADRTVSEARSYDETTIHPPTKSLRSNYDKNNEDGHTMVERDIGSTFVMSQSQLFKPDRGTGSDISNFDSL
ncbi:uncharacterized protein isoform X2 [Rhodnius prolixus]|uniref:uncharacterized protein isoform X2 n=1 Tax=Rhodnius prolixus TaxID=13249 RepID=UPI003D18B579